MNSMKQDNQEKALIPCQEWTLSLTQPQKLAQEGRIPQVHISKPPVHSPTNVGLLPTLTVIPNATQLSEAKRSFKSFENIYRSYDEDDIGDTSLFDIKYENGLLKILCLRVFDSIESNLRNLIAFEQQSNMHHRYLSDYATFMDQLIESDNDVNLLRQKGIIIDGLGENKEVTRFFNKIGKGVSTSAGFYDKQGYRKIIEHCERPWNRMKANLIHNYFSCPWVGASTLAAIVLLIIVLIV
ncbi:putative disease resistance protein RPP13-like [Capsicum annuum]|nr:putative disease resistance protein RPP13-like [Capsicum annuum]